MTRQDPQVLVPEPARLLEGRVVLITGASRGIGAATAALLARHGAAIGVNYVRKPEAAERLVATIVSQGGQAVAVRADVRKPQEVEAMVRQVTTALGSIDTLVLNAIHPVSLLPIVDLPWDQMSESVMGKIEGIFHPVKAVLPAMLERQAGCIIGVSSIVSRQATASMAALSMANAALDAFVRTLAVELGPAGIRANLVAPSLVETDSSRTQVEQMGPFLSHLTPLRRIGQPEDIAGAILLLASAHAQFITGAYLPVSGGMFQV